MYFPKCYSSLRGNLEGNEFKDVYRYLPKTEVILHDASAVRSAFKHARTHSISLCLKDIPPLLTLTDIILADWTVSRSHTGRWQPCYINTGVFLWMESGSAHLYLHSRDTADGTHLEINDSRGPTGPAGELWDICQHTCHTPDCLTKHTHSLSSMVIHSSESASLFKQSSKDHTGVFISLVTNHVYFISFLTVFGF